MKCSIMELEKYLECKGVNLSCVQAEIEMHSKQELLKHHPYKVWEGRDGKWYTYLPDDHKGRIQKKRITKEKLEEDIINFWIAKKENPTVREVFTEWLLKKTERREIERSTLDRYKREFDEHFKTIEQKHICDITESDIKDFMISNLHTYHMTSKAYGNFRTLVFGIFKYAKEKELIAYSITTIVGDMEISRKRFRKKVRKDEEQVYMEDEFPRIKAYLEEHPDMVNMGLLVMFATGMRIGELAGLKCEDISHTDIYVHRTEISYKDESGNMIYEVRDTPKTEAGNRHICCPETYVEYVLKAKEICGGEYLFSINGERLKSYQFRNRLRTINKKLGIVNKSPHKIRKTYATMLLDAGAEESLVKAQMGHSDIKTTKQYYYVNRKRSSGIQKVLNNIFV